MTQKLYEPTQDEERNRERKRIAKAIRSAVRLEYSIQADDHINRVLRPTLDAEARATIAKEDFKLDLQAVLDETADYLE